LGITILDEHHTPAQFEKAVQRAFAEDDAILVEEFIKGKEYRFFLIDAQVVAVLHRAPANVTGDGVSTIFELVERKNENPLRGKGYRTPLEFLKMGDIERDFLKNQNLSPESVLEEGRKVFLRENSNISTGGDSIGFHRADPSQLFRDCIDCSQGSRCPDNRLGHDDRRHHSTCMPDQSCNH
jgi:glutamate--cysteine ligase